MDIDILPLSQARSKIARLRSYGSKERRVSAFPSKASWNASAIDHPQGVSALARLA